jgi:OmpA-OmpF porin, OOP family
MLDQMKVDLPFGAPRDVATAPVSIRQVEIKPMEDLPPVAEEAVAQPVPDSSSLLDEIDLLRALPDDKEIDIQPDVVDPEYALKMSKPAQEGSPAELAQEAASSFEIDSELPELGRESSNLPPAVVGQLVVDPGSAEVEEDSLGRFTDDLMKQGADGKLAQGALDGVASLDALLDLPANLLLAKKTMLPSDLLFEFNKAELRESAKVGLMKVALLMDRNPALYCWIEGHTDRIGSDESNLDLSIRRAEAVKRYLVESLRMDGERISTRGFGKWAPIVAEGDRDAQAINRRVEIRMRKTPPPADQIQVVPRQAAAVAEAPRALLIKPARAAAVAEPAAPEAPRVKDPAAPRAMPVDPPVAPLAPDHSAVPRAEVVIPDVPRAVPVEP